MSTPRPRLAYDVEAAAEAVSKSPETIRRAIRAGELPTYYVGGTSRGRVIKAADLEAWVARWQPAPHRLAPTS